MQRKVVLWHMAFGVPVSDTPKVPDCKRIKLRYSLIKEELDELLAASTEGDIIASADAICDLLYVVFGTACEYGLHDYIDKLFNEVHRSNMSKRDKDGNVLRRDDGKILKSDLYTPPNLTDIIY